jgi:hypothetical protein
LNKTNGKHVFYITDIKNNYSNIIIKNYNIICTHTYLNNIFYDDTDPDNDEFNTDYNINNKNNNNDNKNNDDLYLSFIDNDININNIDNDK